MRERDLRLLQPVGKSLQNLVVTIGIRVRIEAWAIDEDDSAATKVPIISGMSVDSDRLDTGRAWLQGIALCSLFHLAHILKNFVDELRPHWSVLFVSIA